MTDPSADLAIDDRRYFQDAPRDEVPFILERGHGCVVWDTGGREYLDAHASAWLCQIGHGREEMARAAADQIRRLEHFTTHDEFRNPPAIELARRLVQLSPVLDGKVRFSTSGSEADDDAIQLVRRYQLARGFSNKTTILALAGSYHGHTVGGLEVAGRLPAARGRRTVLLTMPDERASEIDGLGITDYCVAELREVIAAEGADSIAAMFGEPVFGPAGMFSPPPDYWPRMVEVLRENDILFVADEVVTAFGRSGEWFGCDLWGVTPDVVVVAKGIASGYAALSAVIISGQIARVLGESHHGGSYAGHPTACALALKNLEIIERESLLDAAKARGAQLEQELEALLVLPGVLDVRGVGMMWSLWLDRSRAVDLSRPLDRQVRDDAGIIVMGDHSRIVITPPLTVTASEVTRIVDGLALTIAGAYR